MPDLTSMSAEELAAHGEALAAERARRRDLDEVRALSWRYVNGGGDPVRVLDAAATGAGLPGETIAELTTKRVEN